MFKEFVKLVVAIRPKFFVMENVLGILTMRNGGAITDIISSFAEVGYHISTPIKLNAEQYGVPQKRKRVFIIGSVDGINISQPEPLFYNEPNKQSSLFDVTSNEFHKIVTVRDAIGSLPYIEDGGGEVETEFIPQQSSPFDRLMRREIDFEEFYRLQLSL